VNPEDAAALALHRSAVYRLLALAFADPTPARLAEIVTVARTAATAARDDVQRALGRLADAAADGDAAMLAGDHLALFQRPVGCPPYEGAYGPPRMGGKGALLADVAGFYRAFGLEPAAGQPEVEDHVCAELEFMSVLAFKEAWAIAEEHADGRAITGDAQRAFLRDHLGGWASAFAARVDDAAPGFYLAAAALLRAWVTADCARLDVQPAPREGVIEADESPFTCPMATDGLGTTAEGYRER
jgi:DMSO reductase family type II enzyme chaperone